MQKLVEAFIQNLSTKDAFLFRISCENCGTEYGNRLTRFSKARWLPATQEEELICHKLYAQEFQNARQTAIRRAAEQLNYCPVCKRLICNQCFLICGELDMCRKCAAEQGQRGQPVLSGVIGAVI